MFALSVAWRFLWHNKVQTLLITLGIAIGVSVQVFIGSLIQGLQIDLIDSTIGNSSHITIQSSERNARMDDDDVFFTMLQSFDSEIRVVSRTLEASANILTDQTDPIIIRAFEFEDANQIYGFDEKLTAGRLPESDREIILGTNLVEMLELTVGDEVTILLTENLEEYTFTLTGVFDFRVSQINETWFVTTLDAAKDILETSGISTYEMQINDVFYADVLADNLQEEIGSNYRVTEWKSANQELLSGLNGQSVSSYMIQLFVIVSVVLGIASVLAVTVLQKSKQLGILKAMGIKDRQASFVFLNQGLLLGIVGAILGVGLGLGLSYMFTVFAVNPDGTPVLDIYINPPFIAFSGMIAIVAALTASILPARRSAKLSVIEVIRNG